MPVWMIFRFAIVVVILRCPSHTAGHGSMYEPPPRNSGGMSLLAPTCAGGACQWYSQGCSIGCPVASQRFSPEPDCENPGDPKLKFESEGGADDSLLQYRTDGFGHSTTYFPWRFPGSAPVLDSCGVTGGGYPPLGQLDPPPGTPSGIRGTNLDYAPKLLDGTQWVAGRVVEVAWGIAANHGGGYQYRLCPADHKLDEECFQKTPLDFVGDKQWIQFGNGYDRSKRDEIQAQRVSGDKVKPVGSTWTRNPIPGCAVDGARDRKPCRGPTFWPAPLAFRPYRYGTPSHQFGIFGYGGGHCMGNRTKNEAVKCTEEEYYTASFDFGIVDLVRVPAHLSPGNYVLSFRWDCEQTKQIWNSCADVIIKAPEPINQALETKPFSPQRGCTPCCVGVCAKCRHCLNKTDGDCAFCWQPIPWWDGAKHWTSRSPSIQCLGKRGEILEAKDGGAGVWMPGERLDKPWSPGCRKCWAQEGSCEFKLRELWQGIPSYDSTSTPGDAQLGTTHDMFDWLFSAVLFVIFFTMAHGHTMDCVLLVVVAAAVAFRLYRRARARSGPQQEVELAVESDNVA